MYSERFTENALLAVSFAQDEARRQEHNYVGIEQLLIALTREKPPSCKFLADSISLRAFRNCGVDLIAARGAADRIDKTKSFVPLDIPFSEGGKRILRQAWELADELGDEKINTAHLLLVVLEDDEGPAEEILQAGKLEKDLLREELFRLRAECGSEP